MFEQPRDVATPGGRGRVVAITLLNGVSQTRARRCPFSAKLGLVLLYIVCNVMSIMRHIYVLLAACEIFCRKNF